MRATRMKRLAHSNGKVLKSLDLQALNLSGGGGDRTPGCHRLGEQRKVDNRGVRWEAPLLGLLGTVYGLIVAFQTFQTGMARDVGMLATGIYEALVTTASGLTIAVPVIIIYQFLTKKIDRIIDELDEMGTGFIIACVSDAKRGAEGAGD